MAVVAAVSAGASGCIAHVVLEPPPPPTAPVEMRETYLEEHETAPPGRGDLEPRARLGATHATFVQKSVRLKNGTRVAYVEDLKPLVDDKSEAGRAIDASLAYRDRADLITMGGAVVGGIGIVAGGAMLATYLTRTGLGDPNTYGADPLTIGALSALVVGGVGGSAIVAWGMTVRDNEEDARAHAFKSFDDSLREKLALPDSAQASRTKANGTPSTSTSTGASSAPNASTTTNATTTNAASTNASPSGGAAPSPSPTAEPEHPAPASSSASPAPATSP